MPQPPKDGKIYPCLKQLKFIKKAVIHSPLFNNDYIC